MTAFFRAKLKVIARLRAGAALASRARESRAGSRFKPFRPPCVLSHSDLEVPRARAAGSAGGAIIGRYKRRSAEIDDAMVSAYVHGASTRDVGQITEALMGEHVSKSAVSRAGKTLGTKVEELPKAAIDGPIP